MIYIVSGYPRSGTSMMMKALNAGGMKVAYSENREKRMLLLNDGNFIANKEFLEIENDEHLEVNFPLQYDGKLIKMMYSSIYYLCPHAYKIVFMLREYTEIEESWGRVWEDKLKPSLTHGKYYQKMSQVLKIMQARKDIDYEIFLYEEVVKEPLKHFNILKAKGWQIDTQRASKIINSRDYRVKYSNLRTA